MPSVAACVPSLEAAFDQAGWQVIPGVFTVCECAEIGAQLDDALSQCADASAALRRRGGALYGARNVLDHYPAAEALWKRPALLAFLRATLGDEVGLVRALYFDKPPQAAWSLPWHRDMTIAVRDNRLPSPRFTNPTRKAGVPHVEAPRELLDRMLTLRIHLDAATPDNGPLQVISGSHRDEDDDGGRILAASPTTILSAAGDVLAQRPRLLHCSGVPTPGCALHRRVLHLEFAGTATLPDGYAWHTFRR